jgi:hypothetical protein
VGKKRMFMRAIDAHLSGRYPMFAGLSQNWPAGNAIGPYVREPQDRSDDFELVNKGFLGYLDLGYTRRDVELFVWLEALRDKQCAEAPCELGVLVAHRSEPQGGCPVKIHIPQMFELIGNGRFREALEMLESCNPLPNVTGRVCPQELQCQGMCIHKHAMSIGQLEWFLPEWDKLANPGAVAARFAGVPDPWRTATRPPVAIVGSGPSGLITAYLLAAEGFPVTVFEAFHELGGVLRYGIPEFRLPNQLIDDVVARIRMLGGRFVTNFVVGRTATLVRPRLRRQRRGPAAVPQRARRAPAERDECQRVPHPGEPDAGAPTRPGDAAAGDRRKAGARDRRRQHGDGRRPHGPSPRRRGHHRLPPHPLGDARAGRGARARAGGGRRAGGAALAGRVHRRRADGVRDLGHVGGHGAR